MSYIYVSDNIDWNKETKYKFGFTTDPINKLLLSREHHSYQSEYIQLYKIEKTKDYIIDYRRYDKIISVIGRNDNIIDTIENHYNNSFTYLRNIKNYLINTGGSTYFIYSNGYRNLHNLLMIEFPLLGLNVSIVKISEILEINKEIKNKNIVNTFNPFNPNRCNII